MIRRLRYDRLKNSRREIPEVDAFLADVIAVFHKHGLSIAHEDHQGSFIVTGMDESNVEWLCAASAEIRKAVTLESAAEVPPLGTDNAPPWGEAK